MFVIGLTGGIGSGKSTVSKALGDMGIPVIDCDRIAHEAAAAGSPILRELSDAFGKDIITPEGELRRKVLGDIVFHDRKKLQILNGIMHPCILQKVKESLKIAETKGVNIVIIDAPLLLELGWEKLADSIWVVTADQETRISRVMKRDHMPREAVMARMKNQMPEEEKIRKADVIIDNSFTKEHTLAEVRCELRKIPGERWQEK